MCGPLALPIASTAMAMGGSLLKGYQGLQQGNYEAGVARLNAKIATDAAHDSIAQGGKEALAFYRRVGQVKGGQVAAMAANGIDVGSGTAAQVQDDTTRLAREDADNLYHDVEQRTSGFYMKATSDMGEANAAKARGRSAMLSGAFEAASSLMSSFSQMKGLSAKMNMAQGGSIASAFGDSTGGFGGFGGWGK